MGTQAPAKTTDDKENFLTALRQLSPSAARFDKLAKGLLRNFNRGVDMARPNPLTDDALVAALLAVGNGESFQVGPFSTISERSAEAFRMLLLAEYEHSWDDANSLVAFAPIAFQLIETMKVKPVLKMAARGLSIRYERTFPSIDTALQFAFMLLLDAEGPYLNALSRCGLSTCNRYYLARRNPKGGPANRFYCDPAHRELAHDRKENRKVRKHK